MYLLGRIALLFAVDWDLQLHSTRRKDTVYHGRYP